jgi:hypothetical protein
MGNPAASALEQLTLLGYKEGETVFYRAITRDKAQSLQDKFPNIPSKLEELSKSGYGIYIVVNGGGHKDADVSEGKAIFYEHDDIPKEDQLNLWESLKLPKPTFQIDTGGKSIHSYWVFDSPIDVKEWKNLQVKLLDYSKGDKSIKNPSRVMRLAGYNHQQTNKLSTIVVKNTDFTWSYNRLLGAIENGIETRKAETTIPEKKVINPVKPKVKVINNDSIPAIPIERLLSKKHRDVLASGMSEGGRDNMGASLVRDLIGVATCVPQLSFEYGKRKYQLDVDGDPYQLLSEYCGKCTPALSDKDCDRIYKSAEKSNPRPSINDEESLINCLRSWVKENTENSSSSTESSEGEKSTEEDPKEKRETAGDFLLKLARKTAIYFHTADKVAYADISIDASRHTYAVRSKNFKLWLLGEYYREKKAGINDQAYKDAISTLEAISIFEGETRQVHLRTAEYQGKLYFDLGTPDWKAVEIDSSGWRVVSESPVRFWRPDSLLPLPIPVEGGSLNELKDLLNVDGSSWTMIATFLLFCFRPKQIYPVLILSAHRGSGKTAAAEIIKGLIDPGKAPLIKLPGDTHKLAVAASNRHLMVYDNVGHISPDQSDNLCTLATNFGYSTRTLNTTGDETTPSLSL